MILGENVNVGSKALKLTGKAVKAAAKVGAIGVFTGIAAVESKKAVSEFKDVVIQIYNLVKNAV